MKNKAIKIIPIKQHQIDEAKQVVIKVCLEIFDELSSEDDLKRYDSMSDIEEVRSHYFANNGTFLVLLDENRVVGSGAMRKLRIWFLCIVSRERVRYTSR